MIKNDIIYECFKNNTSPLMQYTVMNETFSIDILDVKNFFIETKKGKFIMKM